MECINCGAALGAGDTCPNCGANVKIYKKIISTSNVFYNDGLKRAAVRDLSGAAESLAMSLKLNKLNIQARNLLGLVYFEMGETVKALSEWVISKNFMPEGNSAGDYLNQIQNNPARLDSINQTIKKYNQALLYCRQDSRDLAVIQLKKVLSMNPKMVKAYQLLGLLYMQDHKYDLAKKALRSAVRIDSNNITTMRYLKECNHQIHSDPARKKAEKENEELISYVSGNETIIQPAHFKDNTAVTTVINIIIGVAVGVLITWFLVVPGVRQAAKSDANAAVNAANDTISTKEQTILSLESQITDLTAQVEGAQAASEEGDVELSNYKQFLSAYISFANGDITAAGDALATVNPDTLDDTAKQAYDAINAEVNAEYLNAAYTAGMQAYNSANYDEAIQNFEKIMAMDETFEDGNAMYYLAQAYRRAGNEESAITYYQKVVTLYPNTERASNSRRYLSSLGADTEEANSSSTGTGSAANEGTVDTGSTDGTAGTDAVRTDAGAAEGADQSAENQGEAAQ